MSRLKNILFFLLVESASIASAQENCLLTYGQTNELNLTVEVLEIPIKRVLSCPKEEDGQPFSVIAAIKKAQILLKEDKSAKFTIGEHWYSPLKDEHRSVEKSPFIDEDEEKISASNLGWNFSEAIVREVDLGRSKTNILQWRPNLSKRFWVEIKFIGVSPKRGSAGIYLSVFLFQDMSLLVPKTYSISEINK